MRSHSRAAINTAICVVAASLTLVGCAKRENAELQWARAALERNPQLKVVSVDEAAGTIKARIKISGEVLTLTPGELAAIPIADLVASPSPPPIPEPVPAPPPATSSQNTQSVPSIPQATEQPAPEPPAPPTYTVEREDGRVRVTGPGVSIETAPKTAQTIEGAPPRYDEPIVCDGKRFLHLDNRTLNVDGDALIARGGCELHITNSRVTATGTALTVLDATVHIANSTVQGAQGSITTSSAARLFLRGNRFDGLERRSPDAKIQDQGGNSWR